MTQENGLQENKLKRMLSKYNNSQFLIGLLNLKFTDIMLIFRPENGFSTFLTDYKKLVQTDSREMNDIVINRYIDMKLDYISQIMESGLVRGNLPNRYIFFPQWNSLKHNTGYLARYDNIYTYKIIDESGKLFYLDEWKLFYWEEWSREYDDIGAYWTVKPFSEQTDEEMEDDSMRGKNAHLNHTLSDFDRLFHWSFIHFAHKTMGLD